jgi:hypothetical protein
MSLPHLRQALLGPFMRGGPGAPAKVGAGGHADQLAPAFQSVNGGAPRG